MHTPAQRHAENKTSRQGPLAISAILNEEPIDPIPYRPAPEPSPPWTVVDKFENLGYFPSPMSTLSSPGPLRNERANTPQINAGSEAMWDYPSAGMHQTHSGEIIVSSLAKSKRKRILPHQFNRLMEVFAQTNTPSSEIREQLANELEMTKREVQTGMVPKSSCKGQSGKSKSKWTFNHSGTPATVS
ncbi:hypothetical protein EC973_002099 [Apophysomyces ossiformis]|uniref:Homeobox domain-containing protein n=1 Tax=Apophysomyces ossiformis TaxID=679940 RepID=A0A8H7BIS6_9FUNG|nr:hypothetical protein EC973_002099 [Apophysomyces ossiformis]